MLSLTDLRATTKRKCKRPRTAVQKQVTSIITAKNKRSSLLAQLKWMVMTKLETAGEQSAF